MHNVQRLCSTRIIKIPTLILLQHNIVHFINKIASALPLHMKLCSLIKFSCLTQAITTTVTPISLKKEQVNERAFTIHMIALTVHDALCVQHTKKSRFEDNKKVTILLNKNAKKIANNCISTCHKYMQSNETSHLNNINKITFYEPI